MPALRTSVIGVWDNTCTWHWPRRSAHAWTASQATSDGAGLLYLPATLRLAGFAAILRTTTGKRIA
jgi:hypothetical protein